MFTLLRTSALLAVAALLSSAITPARAQNASASSSAKPFVIPPDINGHKTIVAAPVTTRPIRIAIYDGPGSGDSGIEHVEARARQLAGAQITRLSPAEVGTADLTGRFDVIVFSGGSGSKQGNAIGEAGRTNVREFVRNGGGYFGVCAGAYLACANFEWGLGILDARTVSSKWRRGRAFLDIRLDPAGREIFGPVTDVFKVRYNNGPVIKPMGRDDIPDYTPVATYLTEIADNGTPVGVQVGSPAQAIGTFGKGRVFISSPHPENTPGLENMVPRALLWAAGGPTE
jgi:Uncharacterized conserved protein